MSFQLVNVPCILNRPQDLAVGECFKDEYGQIWLRVQGSPSECLLLHSKTYPEQIYKAMSVSNPVAHRLGTLQWNP